MDFLQFRTVLSAFADEPTDIDVSQGKVVAQIRDEIIDIRISLADDESQSLRVEENGTQYAARQWLVNRIAKLPQLADRIIATTASSAEVEAMSPFVMPEGMLSPDLGSTMALNSDHPVSNVVQALIDKSTSPVPGATSVLYITSDAGEGKTTVINRVARVQAQRYKDKIANSLIIPIPLTGRAFLTFDDAVIAALVNRFRFNYLYFDAFVQLVRLGVIIPAFDGYEEMLVEGSKGEAVSALGNLVQSLGSSGTIFIAARKAFFEYLSFRTQARLLDAIGDRSASFSRLSISRWTSKEFSEYGKLRRVAVPEEIHALVAARLGSDHPLLTRAVLVRRLFDVAESTSNRAELGALLGRDPHDYFFTFVDAIVKREANEKWLFRVSSDVSEPLLSPEEHHALLSQIAQEMWQSSATSLRYDVLDVIVDLFADATSKRGAVVRQIKERLKQHSLLAVDPAKAQALSFDHEDFQNFYLGEALGQVLGKMSSADLQAFLSVNPVPIATVEQAIQCVVRQKVDTNLVLNALISINDREPAFSFCKENCGALALRITECIPTRKAQLELRGMYFSVNALNGRTISNITFNKCHFQPTSASNSNFDRVRFLECEFERIEIAGSLKGGTFVDCRIDSVVIEATDERLFDPSTIEKRLRNAGAAIADIDGKASPQPLDADPRLVLLDRFLRYFLRSTQIDEEVIRRRLGNQLAPRFFDDLLPILISHGILAEMLWRGGGSQRRFKLALPLADVGAALEKSRGQFEIFLSALKH